MDKQKKLYLVSVTKIEGDMVDHTVPDQYTHASSEKMAITQVLYRLHKRYPRCVFRDIKVVEVVKQQEEASPVTNPKEDVMNINVEKLEGLKKAELVELCREKNLKGYSQLNKAGLLQFVKDALIRESITVSVDGVPVNKPKEEKEMKSDHSKVIAQMEASMLKDVKLTREENNLVAKYALPKDLREKFGITTTGGERVVAGEKFSNGYTFYFVEQQFVTRKVAMSSDKKKVRILWKSEKLFNWRKVQVGKFDGALKMLVVDGTIYGTLMTGKKKLSFIWDKEKYDLPYLNNRYNAKKAERIRKIIAALVDDYKKQLLKEKAANKKTVAVKRPKKDKDVSKKVIKEVKKTAEVVTKEDKINSVFKK